MFDTIAPYDPAIIPVNDAVTGKVIYLFSLDAADAVRLNPSRYSLVPKPPQSVTAKDDGSATVALLPSSPPSLSTAWAADGRKIGETVGSGTGVRVYYSGGTWRVFSTDAPVTA